MSRTFRCPKIWTLVFVVALGACGDKPSLSSQETVATTAAPVASPTSTTTSTRAPIASLSTLGPSHSAPTSTAPAARPTTPIPPTGRTTVEIGETGLSSGVALTVTRIEFDPCLGTDRAASPGDTILFVDVTIENRSNPGAPGYGGFDWVVFDDQRHEHHLNFVPCRPTEPGPFLEPGVKVVRTLEFEIPGDATGLVLQWDGLGTEDAIRVELGT